MSTGQTIVENALVGDNVDDSEMDAAIDDITLWQMICAAGLAALSAGCIALRELNDAAIVLNSKSIGMSSSVSRSFGSPSFATESSEQRRVDISGTHPSNNSGRSSGKRKALVDPSQDSDHRNLATTMENLSRAIVRSADIIANRVTQVAQPHPNSTDLFNAVIALDLPLAFRLDSYDYLSSNSAAAHKFLGATLEFRSKILQRIMGSR